MNQWIAANLAQKLLAEHGLENWAFRYNHRKRAMGLCRYDEKRIELSLHFVRRNGEAAVRDTILHEIAHAIAGPEAGHGPKWRRVCQQIGAEPTRCGEAKMPAGRWQATCPNCGQRYARHRRPMRGRTYHCRPCGPTRGRLRFAAGVRR
ncbi:MAG: SprT-like domain-containing protein [Phycisphaeraceae bacterium]